MENYYLLSWKDGKKPLASAFTPKGTKTDHDLIKELNGKSRLPFELDLIKLSISKNELVKSNDLTDLKDIWLDYQPNNLAWPLMSERLKLLVESNLTGKEEIDWLTCNIKSKNEEKLYFILRFNKMPDVLDMQKTMFVQGTEHIIRPVFAAFKVSSYNIFTKPSSHDLWKITSSLYVSESLKKAIQKEKLTGIDFEKTSVS